MSAPDWRALGARFGERDQCVEFPFPVTVHLQRVGGAAETLAERVVALRESREGVSVQVACGLILHVPGARIDVLPAALDGARLALGPRARPRAPGRRRDGR